MNEFGFFIWNRDRSHHWRVFYVLIPGNARIKKKSTEYRWISFFVSLFLFYFDHTLVPHFGCFEA